MINLDKKEPINSNLFLENDFLDYALSHQFGDLHFKVDPKTGMRAIIAIHNTKLGPALGGCRFIEYPDTHSAILDVMRLAQGMSYKAASVNLPLGGGKSVIIKPPGAFDREAYFHAFGRFIEELGGRYITALDSGTELNDMDIIAQHTSYVASLSAYHGDPSPVTAEGVFKGIKTAVEYKLGRTSLTGIHIAIQGLGHVGYTLAGKLHEAGAQLTVADINPQRVEKAVQTFGAARIASSDIHAVPCDVYSPCALGGIINDQTINELQTTIIAGAANNQLAHAYHAEMLHQKKILDVPDYVINAGGLIFAASKYFGSPEGELQEKINYIPASLLEIFERSEKENRPCYEIADRLVQEKLA